MKTESTTSSQAKDTALAILLMLQIALLVTGWHALVVASIAMLVLAMTWLAPFRPLARLWFGFSHLLGNIAARVILTVVFALVATPVGLLRRLGGADAMRRKAWKKDKTSVFVERNHRYTAKDLETPF